MTKQAIQNALGNLGYFQLDFHEITGDSLEPNHLFVWEEHRGKELEKIKKSCVTIQELN